MKRKLLTMSALALVCGVSVACSSNTSANVNTNSANTNIAQENTSSQNNINNNNTNAKITSDKAKEIALNHANLSENQVFKVLDKVQITKDNAKILSLTRNKN